MKSLILLLSFLNFAQAESGQRAHEQETSAYKDHIEPTLDHGFDKTGLVIIGSGVVATLLAHTIDYDVRARFSHERVLGPGLTNLGDFIGRGFPEIGIAIGQIFLDHSAGVAHAEALGATFLTTSLLKQINQRNRPSSPNRHSMPSGHTSFAFASATSLTYQYGWKVAVPAYLLATLTAVSRWSEDAHWFSDTVAGAFIGVFWGRATAFHHLPVAPIVSSRMLGLDFHWAF